MSNQLLAEVPFKGVSYSRSLTEAGKFTGDIAVTEDTYNLSLYENTLPAKTALYVVRNGVCVWGGIIWGRTYSLVDKVLSITAAEFTSYLSHRIVWKTWNSAYEATAVVSGNTLTVTLIGGQYNFTVGEGVYLDWIKDYAKYSGYFEVLTVGTTDDNRSVITVPATYVNEQGDTKTIPEISIGTDNPITVETRQDTYQFAQDLLRELNTDLFDFDFANDAIRPGIDLFNEIASVSRSNNVATVVTTKKHEMVPGQKVSIADVEVDANFDNKEAVVLSILSDYSFSYANTGNNVSTTNLVNYERTVSSFKRYGNIATFETTTEHPYVDGDIVYISNVSETFDGYYTIYVDPDTPSSDTVFKVVMYGANVAKSYTETASTTFPPKVKRRGSATYGTFGEHSTLGDIGLDLSFNDDFSSHREANPVIRGYELKTVADIFEDYSTKPNGFEYRVDCAYDEATNSFKKYFKFLPIVPATLSAWLDEQEAGFSGSIPASAYGATNIIFEYPGNILQAEFEENADDAATRFFIQGKDDRLSSDASQPYAAASNHKLLREGWPLLDASDNLDSPDETVLWKQASRLLSESVPPISTFTISVNGSAHPRLGTYNPGDWCSVKLNDDFASLRADSYLEQDYGTDNGVLVRKIVSYDVSVPDGQGYPEEVSLELITEPSVPISGIMIIDGKAII
jgi:hypothetical protein